MLKCAFFFGSRRTINGAIQEAPEDQQNDDNIPDYDNLSEEDDDDDEDGEIQYRDGPSKICLYTIFGVQFLTSSGYHLVLC